MWSMKTARKTPSSHVSRKKSKKFKKFFPVWASGVFEPIKSPENSTPDKKKLTVFTFIFFIFFFLVLRQHSPLAILEDLWIFFWIGEFFSQFYRERILLAKNRDISVTWPSQKKLLMVQMERTGRPVPSRSGKICSHASTPDYWDAKFWPEKSFLQTWKAFFYPCLVIWKPHLTFIRIPFPRKFPKLSIPKNSLI